MPELPEVEVVKRSLISKTQNLIVKAVKIKDGRLRYKVDRKPMPAIALTVDTSAITAIGNDYGYENVFSRQLKGIGNIRMEHKYLSPKNIIQHCGFL